MRYEQIWSACGRHPGDINFTPSFPAEVPGNVQWDFAKANGREDFFYNDGVNAFLDTEDYEWIYSTELHFEKETDDRVFFVAEGIDYAFDILLEGVCIHSQEGMYTKVELDITDRVTPAAKLEVRIHPRPWREGNHSETRQAADQVCKPPVTYGWDWNPRLIISGIWKPAYIETRKSDFIRSCEPFYTLNADRTCAQVRFETCCDGAVTYTVYDPDDAIVYHGTEPSFALDNVRLWWCSGQGEPNLYRWTAESSSDRKEGHIGFRTVRLVRNEGAEIPNCFPKSRYPAPITIELNGRRIFAKGSNWVNPELFFGRITEETYRTQITLAKDANMNIFRCWGGAGINKDAFYALCDKYGIMVWQEFMLACNNYIGTPHYLAILEQEATSIIKQLRRYPSLVLWCGGNELFNGWSGMDDQSHALRLLNKLCYEYDFDRPFLMTSPVDGMAHGGYTFREIQTGRDVFQIFNNSYNTAYTEFGVPSIAPLENLQAIIPAEELFPIQDTPAWRLHHGVGSWTDETWACSDILDRYFGTGTSIEERIFHSQWLQATGYQAIFEEARRQWGHCSMAINWCFCEPWICAANNSLLAYPAKPKPAYFAVRDSLRPTLASARIPKFDWNGGEMFTAEIWYLNDSPQDTSDTVHIRVALGDTEYDLLTWHTGTVDANTNKLGPSVHLKLPLRADTDLLQLILTSENGCGSEYRLLFRNGTQHVQTFALNQ